MAKSRITGEKLTAFQGASVGSLLLRGHLVSGDRLLRMHVAVVIILLALVRRDLRRAVVRLLDIMHIATFEQPLLPRTERTGTALVQFRAPFTVELGHLRQAIPAVVCVEAGGQRLQIDDRAIPYILPVEVYAMVLVDGLSSNNCEGAMNELSFCRIRPLDTLHLRTYNCVHIILDCNFIR